MTYGTTQALADAEASYVAGTIFSGTDNIIEILRADDTVIATASDVVVTATNNILSFTSAAGASVSLTDTATGFQVRPNGGVAQYKLQNINITVAPGDQSTANDTFTVTSHGLTNDQPFVISGDIPTTNPVISDGDTVFAVEVTTNTFKVARESGGAAVDVTAAAASNTTFTVADAVGDENSTAIMKITNGTSLTSGDTVVISTFEVIKYVFSVPKSA